jgi:pentatricopeptide repeat protein
MQREVWQSTPIGKGSESSLARAKAALAMLKAVDSPPPGLLSSVAKACCAAGLWQDARSMLRRMHRASIRELRLAPGGNDDGSSYSSFSPSSVVRVVGGEFLDELPRLHRSLLKFCRKGGNITPALNFADDIQFLASQMRVRGRALRGGWRQRPKNVPSGSPSPPVS